MRELIRLAKTRFGVGALDAASETLLYEQVAAAKIDVASVGTRARLLRFHDVLLELLGNGEWRIRRPDSSRLTAG